MTRIAFLDCTSGGVRVAVAEWWGVQEMWGRCIWLCTRRNGKLQRRVMSMAMFNTRTSSAATNVCTNPHTYTHTHARAHTHTHARAHTNTYAHTHACTRARMHACMHMHTHTPTNQHTNTRTNTYARTNTRIVKALSTNTFVTLEKLQSTCSRWH